MKKILAVLSLLFFSFYMHGQSMCQADFSFTASCPVPFLDASTSSPGVITFWSWNFGDGNTSSMQNPMYAYAANGTYVVCLTIFTTDSCVSTFCDTVTVSCILPPGCYAGFRFDATTNCPTVDFTDTSTAVPGPITNWSWDFGDGNISTMQNPSHTYAADGTYTVCLIASTIGACADTTCTPVVVGCSSQPPTSTIPTISEWGLIIISLMVLIVGTVAIRSSEQKLEVR